MWLIEGCEESGSYDLPAYMDALAPEIGQPDLVVCLDAECGNYDQLWLTTSLRGAVGGLLTVQVLTEGVHSGVPPHRVRETGDGLHCAPTRCERAPVGSGLAALLQQTVAFAAGTPELCGQELHLVTENPTGVGQC